MWICFWFESLSLLCDSFHIQKKSYPSVSLCVSFFDNCTGFVSVSRMGINWKLFLVFFWFVWILFHRNCTTSRWPQASVYICTRVFVQESCTDINVLEEVEELVSLEGEVNKCCSGAFACSFDIPFLVPTQPIDQQWRCFVFVFLSLIFNSNWQGED